MPVRSQAEAHRRRRSLHRKKGVCLWCGGKRRKGQSLCDDCTQQQRDGYADRRESGMCTRCGNPADGWACEPCKKAHNAARRRREEDHA